MKVEGIQDDSMPSPEGMTEEDRKKLLDEQFTLLQAASAELLRTAHPRPLFSLFGIQVYTKGSISAYNERIKAQFLIGIGRAKMTAEFVRMMQDVERRVVNDEMKLLRDLVDASGKFMRTFTEFEQQLEAVGQSVIAVSRAVNARIQPARTLTPPEIKKTNERVIDTVNDLGYALAKLETLHSDLREKIATDDAYKAVVLRGVAMEAAEQAQAQSRPS